MINNLDDIKRLLAFESEDDFYHLQIIKRKKEHPELGSNSYIVKTYYISSTEYLENKFPEIQALCDFHNARACINLNRRSFEKCALQLLRKVTDQILNKDFKSARKAYESVCGANSDESNKKWIVDLDDNRWNLVKDLSTFIQECDPIGDKVITILKTKNGYHLICSPFNLSQFRTKIQGIEVHKNNPTILYIP